MSTLIVPIDLNALCVGQPDTTAGRDSLEPMANFALLPWATESGQPIRKGPFTTAEVIEQATPFQSETTFEAGIHLHWTLPVAFTQVVSEGGSLQFPAVPNRWLVNRFIITRQESDRAETNSMSWVVESDRLLTEPATRRPVTMPSPVDPGAGNFAPFRFMGKVTPMSEWSEDPDGEFWAGLTAVGYGESTFAAYYPNCRTVFGFHDPLNDDPGYDPAASVVIYQVTGWFSNPANDPLAADLAAPGENPFNWTWAAESAPAATLCAGTISGISWNPDTAYLQDTAAPLEVALGNTLSEAVSALLGAQLAESGYDDVEGFLNALQLGWLNQFGTVPDGVAQFQEDLHASAFGELNSHTIWQIREIQSSQTDSDSGDISGQITLPDQLGSDLNQLNSLQTQFNQLLEDVDSARSQLFADWYKYLILAYSSPSLSRQTNVNSARALIRAQLANFSETSARADEAGELAMAIAGQISAIQAELAGLYELVPTAGPRYWQPNNPVVLLSGADTAAPSRDRQILSVDADGNLVCRLGDDIVGSLTLAAGAVPGSAATTLTAVQLNATIPNASAQPPYAAALFQEAVLLSPSAAAYESFLLSEAGGSANPAVINLQGTTSTLATANAALAGGGTPAGVTYAGIPPAPIALNAWTGTPWLPFLIQWRLNFNPVHVNRADQGDASAYPADFLTANFVFDANSVDLIYQTGSLDQLEQYIGSAILTPNAFVNLTDQLGRLLEGGDDPEISAILASIADSQTLAQELTGTDSAFLMREAELQMKVADPLADPVLQTSLVAPVAAALDGATLSAPAPNSNFNPIRCGLLRIDKLRIVDTFGRFKDFAAPATVVASSLEPPASVGGQPNAGFLQPRIVQPSRLLFRWIAASDGSVETNSHPATTPIFGWVLPNHLDDSLGIYDPAGAALGSLILSADETRVLWLTAPGDDATWGQPLAEVFASQSQQLQDFANGIYNGGAPSFFKPFLETINRTVVTVEPNIAQRDPGTAVLLGNPLALTRASLTLDLRGAPAYDQSWTAFYQAVDANLDGTSPALQFNDGGLTGVNVPVQLGDLSQLNDGLVGYWINPTDADDYRQFQAPAAAGVADAESGGVLAPVFGSLTLKAANTAESRIQLSLLIDPRATVHASTGVLPVKSISLPPDQYQAALSQLRISFLNTPVLGAEGNWTIPLPSEVDNAAWEWVARGASKWANQPLSDQLNQTATLDYTPQRIREGWLRLAEPVE